MLAARAAVSDASANAVVGMGDIQEMEVLLRICSFLKPKGLSRLACVSKSFGHKIGWLDGGTTGWQHTVADGVERTAPQLAHVLSD